MLCPLWQAPEDNLSLEWVYGYAGQGQRSNVAYNSQGHIVYPAASMGVVLDKVRPKDAITVCGWMMYIMLYADNPSWSVA